MKTKLVLLAVPVLFSLAACSAANNDSAQSSIEDDLSAAAKSYVGNYAAEGTESLNFATLDLEKSGSFKAVMKDSSKEAGTWSVKASKTTAPDTLTLKIDGEADQTFAVGHLDGAGFVAGGIELTLGKKTETLQFTTSEPSCLTITCESGYECEIVDKVSTCVKFTLPPCPTNWPKNGGLGPVCQPTN